MIFDFLIKKRECKHLNIPVDVDEAYCTDCGELIRNKWYIVRCDCCNIKRTSHIDHSEIKPDTKYCPNCGSSRFYLTEPDKINFTDIRFAVLKREIIKQTSFSTSQIRIEKNSENSEIKLIGFNPLSEEILNKT